MDVMKLCLFNRSNEYTLFGLKYPICKLITKHCKFTILLLGNTNDYVTFIKKRNCLIFKAGSFGGCCNINNIRHSVTSLHPCFQHTRAKVHLIVLINFCDFIPLHFIETSDYYFTSLGSTWNVIVYCKQIYQ